MSDYLKEVLIRRTFPENQQYRSEVASENGIQDVYGNTLKVEFEKGVVKNPQFSGDPRVGTSKEIEEAGFKIKEGAIPEKGITIQDLNQLQTKYKNIPNSEEKKKNFKAEKEALYVDFYNGNQIESDKNEFKPYINLCIRRARKTA